MAYSLSFAKDAGADVRLFGADTLSTLPVFDPWASSPSPEQEAFIAAIRAADGIVIASPAYHGSISGVVKNALDTLELTAKDARPYLQGRAVGAIITSYGWQAAGTSLMALRSIVHALRGWPTPMGVTLNCAESPFRREDIGNDARRVGSLRTVTEQVLSFAKSQGVIDPQTA